MTQMIEMKTAELIGPALDWAVAKCVYEKVPTTLPFDEFLKGGVHGNWGLTESEWGEIQALKDGYSPSTNWGQGGPLIDKYKVDLFPTDPVMPKAVITPDLSEPHFYFRQFGPTPLIAAMRCLVASKLGDTVMVPKELLP